MKAVTQTEYGNSSVLQLVEAPIPGIKQDQVLIKVKSTSINKADYYSMQGNPVFMRLLTGLFTPKSLILGADVAGVIEKIGSEVIGFKVGDEVVADIGDSGRGGFAEFAVAPADLVSKKPKALTFEQAASIPLAGVTALQGIRDHANVQPGQEVMIHGASGGVGLFAAQIARAMEAKVTVVCSTRNQDMLQSLGFENIVDYKKQDFLELGKQYDVVFVANGTRNVSDYLKIVKPGGTLVGAGGAISKVFVYALLGPIYSKASGKQVKTYVAKPNAKDLGEILNLVASGKVNPVIDKIFPLEEATEAMKFYEQGQAQGKVVISIN